MNGAAIESEIAVERKSSPEPTRSEQLTLLRGQITLLRQRYQLGFAVGLESLKNAEQLARSLELQEAKK
jgi:hypothetical protein